jgi:5-methylthioadenosine/S-adenosylhomocysteine deaminase
MSTDSSPQDVLLIKGGRVYDHSGNIDQPPVADVLVIGNMIAAVRAGLADAIAGGQSVPELGTRCVTETIDAAEKLVIPGFVNAHYHSHDVLLKGCFETIPLELWVLSALPPSYPKRSTAEIRARTLLGSIECLRSGITTVQDLATIYPFDEEHLDAMLKAYGDVGIRCVFALQIADVPGVKSIPFWDEVVPADQRGSLSGAVEPYRNIDLPSLVRDLVKTRRNVNPRITWALGPSSPERCSEDLLSSLAEFSADEKLPVYTHIYESKAMTLIARQTHAKDGGSLINYLKRVGLLTPRLSLAHSVWMAPQEIERLQESNTNVVLNPVGNLKTRSGIAPIRTYMNRGVNVGLGCDNCSCSDAQNMFQSMKMFASLAAVCTPEPGPPTAGDAIWSATIGGARTAGLEGRIGALKPGMAADLSIIDLTDPSFVPLNSVARQLVFTESGRGVETVIVDGRVVVRDRKITTIDERALREEVADLMKTLRKDIDAVIARNQRLMPYLMEAYRRTWATDIGLNRYVGGGTD